MSEPDYTGTSPFGVTLAFATVGGVTGATISPLLSLSVPKDTIQPITYTPIDNAAATEFKVPGKQTSGQLSAKLIYQKARYNSLKLLKATRLATTWTATYPDGSTDVGSGFLSEVAIEPLSDSAELSLSFIVEMTGAMTFTPDA
jgi:hypothetical protein